LQILSDDWTKTIHLQSDRTLDFHNQAQSYYRTRIPRFGRSLAYNFPTCDALVGGQGGEVFRLNLEQGRFLSPFQLEGTGGSSSTDDVVTGVNAIDINPAHHLLAFGTETELGKGTVELWDNRARSRVGLLRLPYSKLGAFSSASASTGIDGLPDSSSVSVTALASRLDGLNLAVGTSSGHTLIYDLRDPNPYTIKDQGYGLPIKSIRWPTGPTDDRGGLVATVDERVLKVWDRNTVRMTFISSISVRSLSDLSSITELDREPCIGESAGAH
jgi:ribosome biogenesis protein ENP2